MLDQLSERLTGLGAALLPELFLTGWLVLLLLLEVFGSFKRRRMAFGVALLGVSAYGLLLFYPDMGKAFGGVLERDTLALGFQQVFVVSTLLTLVLAWADEGLFVGELGFGEFVFVLSATLLALGILAMARELILVFVALEMVAIGGYVLVHFRFRDQAAEASLKYLLFGMVSSALMLYGFSWLYGLSGSLLFNDLAGIQYSRMAFLAVVLVQVGLLFKLSAPPFHFWAPDVYEGSAASVAGFLSVGSKAGGLLVFVRFYALYDSWEPLLYWVAILSGLALVVGNTAALWQTGSKRLMAYSSVSHTGFLLMAVLAENEGMLLFYLWVFLLLNFGVFALIQHIECGQGTDQLSAFSGWGRMYPLLGVGLVILMLGLAGLPPTAGLTAKFWLFAVFYERFADDPPMIVLLLVGVLSSVVGLFYYLKMPFYAFLREGTSAHPPMWWLWITALGLVGLVLGLFFVPVG
ncbi:MAG: NADH-quinone oxidoreductase subunit N [Bernardetiaceae bacterium]